MAFEDFMEGLDATTVKRIRTAENTEIVRLPLASYGLTKALNGGIAKGRISLFYGVESAGKSLLLQESVALWQSMGLVCAYIDVEQAYDKEWCARLGVNNAELLLVQAQSSAVIEESIRPLLENGVDVLIIDSISDIMPAVFFKKDGSLNLPEDRQQLGAQARAITILINGMLVLYENTAIVLISQTTTYIGKTYTKQVPHGGKKVLFASSQIVKMTSSNTDGQQIKGSVYIGDMAITKPIGRRVELLVEKNKLGPQHRTCEYDMYYAGDDVGIDKVGEVIDEAVAYKIITVSARGGWHTWGENKWQGRPMVVQFFKEQPDELDLLIKDIAEAEAGTVEQV